LFLFIQTLEIFGFKFVLRQTSSILFFWLLFLSLNTRSQEFIPLDHTQQGENRINLSIKDIELKILKTNNLPDTYKVKTIIDKDSLRWIRYNNLLLPTVRIKFMLNSNAPDLSFTYKNKIYHFQQNSKNSYFEVIYSLFEKHSLKIFKKNDLLYTIDLKLKQKDSPQVLIDYSCSRNNINVTGLVNEYLVIGCSTIPIGSFGNEKPMLQIEWISPDLDISKAQTSIYRASFLNQYPITISAKNRHNKDGRTFQISSKIPKRLHRLFTAYGLGPYYFETSLEKEGKQVKNTVPTAPALFFYLNYKISETTSIRGFDAAIWKDSSFNNAGLYLGNDFGYSLDKKLYFTTLLGVQYLYFKFDKDSPEVSEPIFPQGIEFMYRHAFDIPNYIVSGGVFFSTTNNIDYENVWIRWGKNYFWELNYIHWGKDLFEAKTWGISVGFPFKGFL